MRACVLLVLLAGCGAAAPSVDIGTGETHFEALHDGQDVTLVHGAQGLHHMWMSLRVDGLKPEKVWLDIDVTHGGEKTHSRNITKLTTDDDENFLIGWPVIMKDPEMLDGESVKLDVTVTDVDGNAADASIAVRLHMPQS